MAGCIDVIRITQIACAESVDQKNKRHISMVALTEKGLVYRFSFFDGTWKPLPPIGLKAALAANADELNFDVLDTYIAQLANGLQF